MSTPLTGISVKQFTFNGGTYDQSSGGPVEASFSDMPSEVADLTGADQLSQQVFLVDEVDTVRISMRQAPVIAKGTKSALVITTKTKGSDRTITHANMLYVGRTFTQGKDQLTVDVLNFRHESADGSTAPVSQSA